MVGFCNLVGTGIAPVSTKTAVKSLSLTLTLVKSSMCTVYSLIVDIQKERCAIEIKINKSNNSLGRELM